MGSGSSVASEQAFTLEFTSAEEALAAGKSQLEVHAHVAAATYIQAFNARDEAAIRALLAPEVEGVSKPPVMLGNSSVGAPRPMKSDIILKVEKGVMFEAYGFTITRPAFSCDGAERPVVSKSDPNEGVSSRAPAPSAEAPDLEIDRSVPARARLNSLLTPTENSTTRLRAGSHPYE